MAEIIPVGILLIGVGALIALPFLLDRIGNGFEERLVHYDNDGNEEN